MKPMSQFNGLVFVVPALVLLLVAAAAFRIQSLPTHTSFPVTVQAVRSVAPQEPVEQEAVDETPVLIVEPRTARLTISSIGVDAVIRDMGLTPDGDMAVPDSTVDVGWFGLGIRPGQQGSAVIGGHNRWDNVSAVFERLDQLQAGDVVSVTDLQGVSSHFVVREMRTYNPTDDATEIFSTSGGVHLNLITCSGVYDPSTKTYTKRLVVFTDALQLAGAY
jgi:LPXTG-site transpeptidase (sortase) family protein